MQSLSRLNFFFLVQGAAGNCFIKLFNFSTGPPPPPTHTHTHLTVPEYILHIVSYLILGTWNIRIGLSILDRDHTRPHRRTALISNELSRYNIDIAALSETRLADESVTEPHCPKFLPKTINALPVGALLSRTRWTTNHISDYQLGVTISV